MELFNDGWKFILGDSPVYRSPEFDDSGWRILDLPHDWSIEGDYSPDHPSGGSGGFFPEGIGWYRKSFSVDSTAFNRLITIRFDGVYMNSEVWVNGHFLGRYPYGYTTFQYDMTEYLTFGEDEKNILSVRVDNSLPLSTRWYNGSGIYRNVWLITTAYTHFHNYHGIYVTTPEVSEESAMVQVDYDVVSNLFSEEEVLEFRKNKWDHTPVVHKCLVRSVIHDWSGTEVARTEETHQFFSFTKSTKLSQTITLETPRLWSAESPEMYQLHSEIVYNGHVVDRVVTPFGVRKLEFIPQKGMFVNGQEVKLKGVCLHHDGGSVGAAVPVEVWHYRFKKLKEMGCNALRTAHNPMAPEFYDLCDSMGFYVMDEAFDEWTRGWPWNFSENNRGKASNGYHLYFDQWAETDLRAMIRRDRNHPCIVMYSIGNEVPDQKLQEGWKTAKRLTGICHQEDPTRPVTAGCDQYLYASKNGFLDQLDVSGYNYVDRHHGDAMYSVEYEKRPEKLCVGTETSRTARNFLAYRDNPYVMGQFIWVGIDYLGESRNPPRRGWQSGLFDMSMNPRSSALMHECYWSPDPVVHIVAGGKDERPRVSWNREKGDTVTVSVYSNCDEVELFLGRKSLGRRSVDRDLYTATWDLDYQPGRLRAVGYMNGDKAVTDEMYSTGKPHHLVAIPVSDHIQANGMDVAMIEISVVDKEGHVIPEAENEITVEIAGDAKLIGLDSGNLYYDGNFKTNVRQASRGRLLAIVRAGTQPGEIQVRASAAGLEPTYTSISVMDN